MIGRFRPTPGEAARRSLHQRREISESDHRVGSYGRGPLISLAGHRVGLDSLDHTMYMATSGSGKNLLAGPMIRSMVETCTDDPTRRMLIVEAKGQITQALEGMGAKYDLITLSSKHGYSPDFAKDFDTYTRQVQLAYNLVPRLDGNNAFFRNGARGLLVAGAVSIHQITGGEWGVDDLVNFSTEGQKIVQAILKRTKIGRRFLRILDSTRDATTLYKLRTELFTHMEPLMTAAAKYQVSDALSVIDFWEGKTEAPILVIKVNPEHLDAERAAVSALLQRSFEHIMSLTPPVDPRDLRKDKLILLDDAGFYRRIPKFLEATELIRGNGGLLIALNQSVESLRSRTSYGDEADGLLANFPNLVMLLSASPITAKWFSSRFGQIERVRLSLSRSFGKEGVQWRADERRSVENLVFDREFLNMTPPSPESGVTCYLKTQAFGEELKKVIPWEQIIERTPPTAYVDFSPLPSSLQEPADWDMARLEFLCLGKRLEDEVESQVSSSFGSSLDEFETALRRIVFDIGFDMIERLVDPETGQVSGTSGSKS